jgi:hypothetical protein
MTLSAFVNWQSGGRKGSTPAWGSGQQLGTPQTKIKNKKD